MTILFSRKKQQKLIWLVPILGITFFGGCAQNQYQNAQYNGTINSAMPEVVPDEIDEVLATENLNPKPGSIPEIGSEEDEINKVIKEGIPVEINDQVEKWIYFFTEKRPDLFQRYLDRGERYKPMIVSLLRDRGIPTELYYQALIESGFVQSAVSSASAVGIWQFIKGTGKRYGLRIDSYADERIDPHRATIAATIYLNDLHNVFDSWYLAMAAYNAGEMRIMRAIMKGKTRDFWELAKGKFLPRETMNYIPKFLAATIIGSNPEKYGFRKPESTDTLNPVAVSVPSALPLRNIAKLGGLTSKELYQLNKHLKKKITPPGKGDYKVWIPREKSQLIADNVHKLKSQTLAIKYDNLDNGKRRYHRVRRGESLTSIAQKYGLSIVQLKRMNTLKNNRIYAGSRLRISSPSQQVARNYTESYRVRRGDTLYGIAAKHNMSVQKLKKINNLRSNRIYIGARLKVSSQIPKEYRVRRGDNLHAIARKFGTTVGKIKRMNRLKRSTIYAGQVLRIGKDRT